MNHHPTILPGATIGILGGGQLGRMLCLVCKRMGYSTFVWEQEAKSPAGQVADRVLTSDFSKKDRLSEFLNAVDVVTVEIENVPLELLQEIEKKRVLRPSAKILAHAQDRLKEKQAARDQGIPTAEFFSIENEKDLQKAWEVLGGRMVLKTSRLGYDGKGQAKPNSLEEAKKAWKSFHQVICIAEAFIDLDKEFSVLGARNANGEVKFWSPTQNAHVDHILDVSLSPAVDVSEEALKKAMELSKRFIEKNAYEGIFCLEFFYTKQGDVLFNELAPRPHNSGHWTLEGSVTSQFEQQLRAVCNLPLGSTCHTRPYAAMANLLGDLWLKQTPNWTALLSIEDLKLHLYGKEEAKAKRKMGHLTSLGNSPLEVQEKVIKARTSLCHNS